MEFFEAIWALLGELAYPSPAFRHRLEVIGDVATLTALVAVALFAISYRVFFNWKRTEAGRALSQFTLALTSVLGLVLLARMLGPEYAFRWILRDTIYVWCAWSGLHLNLVLWANWRRGEARILDIEARPRPNKEK